MSVQISFFHSEKDVLTFAEMIKNCDCVLINKMGAVCDDISKTLCDDMQTEGHIFWIARMQQYASHQSSVFWDGHMIELSNCAKGNSASRTYREGRLYLCRTSEDVYDQEMKIVFERMRKYIKRNYSYSSKSHVYFGPDFLDHHLKGYYHAVYGGVLPIVFEDKGKLLCPLK